MTRWAGFQYGPIRSANTNHPLFTGTQPHGMGFAAGNSGGYAPTRTGGSRRRKPRRYHHQYGPTIPWAWLTLADGVTINGCDGHAVECKWNALTYHGRPGVSPTLTYAPGKTSLPTHTTMPGASPRSAIGWAARQPSPYDAASRLAGLTYPNGRRHHFTPSTATAVSSGIAAGACIDRLSFADGDERSFPPTAICQPLPPCKVRPAVLL